MAGYPFSEVGLYYKQSELILTANHINGTEPIIEPNPKRKAIKFGGTDTAIILSFAPSKTIGLKYASDSRDGEYGGSCHIGSYYLTTGQSFIVGDVIGIWEAEGTVIPENPDLPELKPLTGTFTFERYVLAGTAVGTVGNTTPGSTLSIVNNTAAIVALTGSNQIVRGLGSLTNPDDTEFTFTVRESHNGADPTTRDTVFTCSVTGEVDTTAPVMTSTNPTGYYYEGEARGGTLTASETVTWSKTGTDASLVTLNTTTGVWAITATTSHTTKPVYNWVFVGTDKAGLTTSQVVTINIAPINAIRNEDGGFVFNEDGGYVLEDEEPTAPPNAVTNSQNGYVRNVSDGYVLSRT